VSEPLSDYQRWSYSIAHQMVEAGEDIRWVPRRLVSSIPLPGNFYLFCRVRDSVSIGSCGNTKNPENVSTRMSPGR
ncbi:DUF6879 family protein, partial [Streptosporangium sp. NPDC049644]|uniref:DUF6879 family protein n=1 Tax=Streptosporangium sp. NPDC049644 TaxID=3155507 RepID=UPI0034128AC4